MWGYLLGGCLLGNYIHNHYDEILSHKPDKMVICDMNSTESDLPLLQYDLTEGPNSISSLADELTTPEFRVYAKWHVASVCYVTKDGVCKSVNINICP